MSQHTSGEIHGRIVLLEMIDGRSMLWSAYCACGARTERKEHEFRYSSGCATCVMDGKVAIAATRDEREKLGAMWAVWAKERRYKTRAKRRSAAQKDRDAGDLIGRKFGRLKVKFRAECGRWSCDCDCGTLGVLVSGGRLAAKRDGAKKCAVCARVINLPPGSPIQSAGE